MTEDLQRLQYLQNCRYNFHPGSHVGQGPEVGIEYIVSMLDTAMFPDQNTTVLLETMAGKGTEVGRTFEEIAAIIENVKMPEKWASAWIPVTFLMADMTSFTIWMMF